jgi:hypothetical protein
MTNKLGKSQIGLLKCLGDRHLGRFGTGDTTGGWSPRAGWNYGGTGATLRLLQGLLTRGLVEHDREAADRLKQPLAACFKLTQAGMDEIKRLKGE